MDTMPTIDKYFLAHYLKLKVLSMFFHTFCSNFADLLERKINPIVHQSRLSVEAIKGKVILILLYNINIYS